MGVDQDAFWSGTASCQVTQVREHQHLPGRYAARPNWKGVRLASPPHGLMNSCSTRRKLTTSCEQVRAQVET